MGHRRISYPYPPYILNLAISSSNLSAMDDKISLSFEILLFIAFPWNINF